MNWLEKKRAARAEAQDELRGRLKPGDTIIVTRVRISPDGRFATFKVFMPPTHPGGLNITKDVCLATGFRVTPEGFLGYGGDTAGAPEHIVRQLGERLWGDAGALTAASAKAVSHE
jgi:hypothetical protein